MNREISILFSDWTQIAPCLFRWFSADDLEGALREIEAISSGTRCQKYLFSLSLSPPEGESVPIHIFENTIEKIEKKLGLEDQPRAIIFHEKDGRRHAHCVWSRIAMRQKHREERDKMKEFHDQRKAQETKQRSDRMARGLLGIWHRLTGKYQQTRIENEAEAKLCEKRDREQKQFLIERQLQERQKIQDQYKAVKAEHYSVLQNLREHTAHYLSLGRAMAERPKSADIQRVASPEKARSHDKGRG